MKTNEVWFLSSLCLCICMVWILLLLVSIILGDGGGFFFVQVLQHKYVIAYIFLMWKTTTELGMNQKTIRKTFFFSPRVYMFLRRIFCWQTPQKFARVGFYYRDKGKKLCEPRVEHGKFTGVPVYLLACVHVCVRHGKVFNKSNTKPIKMLCWSEWCIHLLRIYILCCATQCCAVLCVLFYSSNNFRLISGVFIFLLFCLCLSTKFPNPCL